MASLLEEARATARATVWLQRTRGIFMGIPLVSYRFAFIKENGESFNATNWLLLATYNLIILVTAVSIWRDWPVYIIVPLTSVSGFMIGRVFRWLREK